IDRPICDASPVTDDTVTQLLLDGQEAVLTGLAAGAPADDLIQSIADLVERCLPGVQCSVLTSEPSAGEGRNGSGPVRLGGRAVGNIVIRDPQERAPTDAERPLLERCASLVAVVLHREAEDRRIAAIDSRYRVLIQEMPVVAYEGIGDGPMRTFVSPHIES